MPGSRGNSPNGVDPAKIAAWQARRFSMLRAREARARRPSHADRMPADPIEDRENARRILDELTAAERAGN